MSRSRPRNIWSGNHRPCKSLVEFLDFDFKKHNMARSHEKMHLKSIQQATFWSYILFYIYIYLCVASIHLLFFRCLSSMIKIIVSIHRAFQWLSKRHPPLVSPLSAAFKNQSHCAFSQQHFTTPWRKRNTQHETYMIMSILNSLLLEDMYMYQRLPKKNTCINVDIELFNVYIRLSPVTQCQWRQKNQKGRMMNNEQLHIWLQRVSRCRTRVCSTIITNHFVYK